MSKKRIHELAKELGLKSTEALEVLRKHNISVSSHMQAADENMEKVLRGAKQKEGKATKTESTGLKQQGTEVKAMSPKKDNTEKHGQATETSKESKKDNGTEAKQGGVTPKKSSFRHVQIMDPKEQQRMHREQGQHRSRGERQGTRDNHRHDGSGRNGNKGQSGENRNSRHDQGRNSNREGANHTYMNNSKNQHKNTDKKTVEVSKDNRHREDKNEKQRDNNRKVSVGKVTGKDKRNGEERKDKRDKNRDRRNDKGGKNRPQSLLSTSIAKSKNKVKLRNEQNRQQKEEEKRRAEAAIASVIELDGPLTVKALAEKMGREVSEIIKSLMLLGVMATINQEIDVETAMIVAEEFGVEVHEVAPAEDPTEIQEIEDAPETLQPRPPVVTIMGHVDHGKTSLLDVIRKTNVTASEAGGITQHIGAYMVRYQGNRITFLDTPGHEAFTAMRLRGAQSTDIAVLVVAADDGVMPQTIEAINHAKSAKVPIIVAINKMDKPGANPDHVKQQLSEHGLLPEEWGGDVIMVPVSAKKREGIEDLLETILLVAEVMELKANPNRNAQGIVIEAQLDKGRGPVCTVLVQKGSLRVGDTIIAGTAYGKVRAMTNERGEKVKIARPSMPVEVLGLSDVPLAGEIMDAVEDNVARSIAEKRMEKQRAQELQKNHKITLDDIFNQIQQGELKELNLIIKADVQGSVEALRQSLEGIKNSEVRIVIVHSAVGAINESDVMLASASNAIILGFNVRPDAVVRKAAERESVDLRTYRVIYDAINDVESAMRGMLAPEFKEVVLGRAEVRQVISTPKAIVAGSYVTEGKITNNSEIRLIRDGIVVHEGKVDSLRRFKDEVKEVKNGFECGISIERYRDIKEGDVIEAYIMEEVAPTL